MLDLAIPQSATGQVVPPTPAAATAGSQVSFHDVLSALNPLQYVPVIGTIYRAVTGDQIPEPLRRIGTLIASFLMGGPIGAVINVAVLAAERERVQPVQLRREGVGPGMGGAFGPSRNGAFALRR